MSQKRFISDKVLRDETDSSYNTGFRGFAQGALIQGVRSPPSNQIPATASISKDPPRFGTDFKIWQVPIEKLSESLHSEKVN